MENKINKIINIIHKLREEGMIANVVGGGQIAGTAESGDDPPVRKKRKKYISGGKGSRKIWLDYFKK
jgi:hypothetical protein